MSIKIHNLAFISPSSSNPWRSQKSGGTRFMNNSVPSLDFVLCDWSKSRKKWVVRHALTERSGQPLSDFHLVGYKRHRSGLYKSGRRGHFLLFSTAEDGVILNGSPQSSTRSDTEEMRLKLIQSLQGNYTNDGLVQSLHDAARVFELAIKEQRAFAKISWFSTAWLGVDRNAWVKSLSYQASVYSLLQAVSEISSRGDGRDRDINVFVQRSVARQSASLESVIRDQLSEKQPEVFEWLWSEQIPLVVTTFLEYFEKDTRFTAATSMSRKGFTLGSGTTSDMSLLMLALTCIAAITKLGAAKVSCSQFFSVLPDTTGRLMDMFVDFVPMRQAYHSVKEIGLRREFLIHFGPRAATCGLQNDRATEEVIFWVDLVQRQLQRAIDRERIWSRLTTSESIEVLERDLAIFGFFIVLGRSTENFLLSNGFDVLDDPLDGFIRYLIGGSVLYYPQLSSISSYQLYVEVVCEELDWLPFYPGHSAMPKVSHGHKVKREGPPNSEAIPQVLNVCSYWMQSFIKYSKWLEAPVHAKAARFLSRGHNKLMECMDAQGVIKNCTVESQNKSSSMRTRSETYLITEKEPDSFDKALESVDEALIRLEELLQQMHVSGSNPGREHLKAACSDLERIRKLKKEAEFLEASFRAKANSLQQGDENSSSHSSYNEQQKLRGQNKKSSNTIAERSRSKPRGMWTLGLPLSVRRNDPSSSNTNNRDEKTLEQTSSNSGAAESESNESNRFELLKKELIELEMRVQRSSDRSEVEEDIKAKDDDGSYTNEAEGEQLVLVQESENILAKSFNKLKETGTDVWQGTQLLAVDTGAAMELLRRALVGDELTEKEKKVLRRTITDLASVIPIGILMLLPVTAIGHAAMLAAIQKYVPSLIPSTYGPERLNLLRQLEKVKEIDADEVSPDENTEESA